MKELKINLGCGTDIKKGYVNVDLAKLPDIDVKHDLNRFPYPFKGNSADEIYMNHVIGHLDSPTAVVRECHRILKKGGKLIIIEPHFTAATAFWGDIRKWQFSQEGFLRYKKGNKRSYYFDFAFDEVKVKFNFQKGILFWYNYFVEFIANRWPYAYEMTPLQVFPCIEIIVELTK